jgi:hypothetical protein
MLAIPYIASGIPRLPGRKSGFFFKPDDLPNQNFMRTVSNDSVIKELARWRKEKFTY